MNHATKTDLLARCVLVPGVLDADTLDALRRIPCDSPAETAALLAQDVRDGLARVCRIEREGVRVGFLIFGIDRPANELVIHAAFGADGRENLMPEIFEIGVTLGRECECGSIRFHTMRPGLVRLALERGYRASEVTMRKAIT